MQFAIRDLLLFTSVAALAVVACVSYGKADRIDSQIRDAEYEIKSLEDAVERANKRLLDFEPRMDYVEQIRLASEAAADDFDTFRKRNSDMKPEPGKVVARTIPEFVTGKERVVHLRLSVPTEYPVFLRSAIKTTEKFEYEESLRIVKALDQVAWQSNAPFSDPKPHEIRLEPGLVDLWISINGAGDLLGLRLGEKCILSTKFLGEQTIGFVGTGGLTGDEPYVFSLKQSTKKAQTFELDEHEVWIWLSSKHAIAGFVPFSENQSAQEAKANE